MRRRRHDCRFHRAPTSRADFSRRLLAPSFVHFTEFSGAMKKVVESYGRELCSLRELENGARQGQFWEIAWAPDAIDFSFPSMRRCLSLSLAVFSPVDNNSPLTRTVFDKRQFALALITYRPRKTITISHSRRLFFTSRPTTLPPFIWNLLRPFHLFSLTNFLAPSIPTHPSWPTPTPREYNVTLVGVSAHTKNFHFLARSSAFTHTHTHTHTHTLKTV